MWETIAIYVLRYRLLLLLGLFGFTGFMAWEAKDIQLTYDFAKIVPEDDPKYIAFKAFRETFGEDGNVMTIGMQSRALFDVEFLNAWKQLGDDILAIDGIEAVLSITHAFEVVKDTATRSPVIRSFLDGPLASQAAADSFEQRINDLPFYRHFLYNPDTKATILAITFNRKKLDSKDRLGIVDTIVALGDKFGEQHDEVMHYSGLPYLRTYNMTTISRELRMFLLFAMVVLAGLLLFLFRNVYAVVLPLIVVVFGAVWSLGTLVILGYKITILTGLLPTLIVVIGIPNCVYMINKYHSEYRKHGNKQKALARTISKIGLVTLFTNLTTAIGFGVFYFTDTKMLDEFGIVAFLNILATFLISVILIPVMFSYLPEPKTRQLLHLDNKVLLRILDFLEVWALSHRRIVYLIFGVGLVFAIIGLVQLKAEGYILDDVSKSSKVYKDLKFFEQQFSGIMPFEITVDTRKDKGATDRTTMAKLVELEDSLALYPVFSRPLSLAEGYKFLVQSYYNGNPKYYRLPTGFELSQNPAMRSYLRKFQVDTAADLSIRFTDSSARVARISYRMADIGSDSLPKLLADIQPIIDSIFPPEDYDVQLTGTSIIAIEGFNFLIDGLVYSVGLAFILIALIMAYLFRSLRMLLLSLAPNIFPLLVTAGIMGFFDIPLKPSTVLIFSVAFGISVDYTIHFLAKYRQELMWHNWDIVKTVRVSLRETGVSMIYTSLILFFGFIVFTGSEFDGTANLGRLTSITLVVAMLSNLVFLPALLVSVKRWEDRRAVRNEVLTDVYNEEEDIDFDKLDFDHEQQERPL